MECVKGAVCCSPAVHQFFRVKKTELTLWGCSIFVQRIFVDITSFMGWMTTSLESHSSCLSFPFTLKLFLHVHFFCFKSHLQLGHPFSSCAFSSLIPVFIQQFLLALYPNTSNGTWLLPADPVRGFPTFLEIFWEEVEAQVNTLARRRMIFLRKNQKFRTLILNSFISVCLSWQGCTILWDQDFLEISEFHILTDSCEKKPRFKQMFLSFLSGSSFWSGGHYQQGHSAAPRDLLNHGGLSKSAAQCQKCGGVWGLLQHCQGKTCTGECF